MCVLAQTWRRPWGAHVLVCLCLCACVFVCVFSHRACQVAVKVWKCNQQRCLPCHRFEKSLQTIRVREDYLVSPRDKWKRTDRAVWQSVPVIHFTLNDTFLTIILKKCDICLANLQSVLLQLKANWRSSLQRCYGSTSHKTEEKPFEGILKGLVALFKDDLRSIGSKTLTYLMHRLVADSFCTGTLLHSEEC